MNSADENIGVLKTGGMAGFSLIELIVAMVLTLIIMGIAVVTFSTTLGRREREASRTDALTSAQAALNIMSREIGNSGYGLTTNGLVLADCTDKRLHFRANTVNAGNSMSTNSPGEDVTFYYDTDSQSVVRYDAITGTSGVINRVSDVDFLYYNYTAGSSAVLGAAALNTGRVNITLKVILADVRGQPANQTLTISSDVTLRNSPYMLGQY
ncbi:MAG: prepilin-type N-terminal cleavage/methylation domain-containing protein [Pyrinomonadaceae bacterium]|nr:prepilin-type N-terminal cleavage/methylation domain-containing protein [Acidobacteriota bacterium]MBK7932608.1 prepilin-type N-terminal cleavage/methylation domain-containing protein [Acidobacteriota bacterium]MBP7377123.1 prepilin-type N-terminal cleavage/methylation domain-containing protein [Pyrinomonadaceae bacterium]